MKPTTKRVLRALIAAGSAGATTRDLCQPDVGGVRFGGRLHELRGMGLNIETRRERQGSNRYWLRKTEALDRLLAATDGRSRA